MAGAFEVLPGTSERLSNKSKRGIVGQQIESVFDDRNYDRVHLTLYQRLSTGFSARSIWQSQK